MCHASLFITDLPLYIHVAISRWKSIVEVVAQRSEQNKDFRFANF